MSLLLLFLALPDFIVGQNSYQIIVHDNHLEVEGEFQMKGDTLYMIIGSSPDSKSGQQELVSQLSATRNGKPVDLQNKAHGIWVLPETHSTELATVSIKYQVDLRFDEYNWNSGKEEMAYGFDNGYVFSMRSVFIWPLEKYDIDEQVKIKFKLPPNQRILSPWNLAAPNARAFTVPDFVDFLFNTFIIGTFETETIEVEQLKFTMVTTGQTAKHTKAIQEVLSAGTSYFTSTIGPLKGDYLLLYADGDRNDGGAFEHSFSQTIKGAVNKKSLPFWGGLSVHELYHLWHGRGITFESSEEEWIVEGWADYLTLKAMANQSIIDKEQWLRKLENSIRKYQIGWHRITPGTSLAAAGQHKGDNRMLLYGGGALAALYLDIQIMQQTHFQADLNTVLQKMFSERNLYAFSNDSLQKKIERVTRNNYESFFQSFIYGKEKIPVESLMEQIGLQMDVFGYEDIGLSFDQARNPLRKQLFGL